MKLILSLALLLTVYSVLGQTVKYKALVKNEVSKEFFHVLESGNIVAMLKADTNNSLELTSSSVELSQLNLIENFSEGEDIYFFLKEGERRSSGSEISESQFQSLSFQLDDEDYSAKLKSNMVKLNINSTSLTLKAQGFRCSKPSEHNGSHFAKNASQMENLKQSKGCEGFVFVFE